MRVLILAPTGRDARLLSQTLMDASIQAKICVSVSDLIWHLKEGAAALLMTEEALLPADIQALSAEIESQPPWSDMSCVVITFKGRPTSATVRRSQELRTLGNVTMLERPVRPETVETALEAALRARMRQYEMRRRQEMLVRVNKDLEHFAYTASHDLREPVRNIAIFAEILNERYKDVLDERGREYLGFVNEGARRIDLLLRDLLDYTKVSSIGDELPEPIDAEKPLRVALANLHDVIRQNDAQLDYDCLPFVRVHEVHLQQLFQNLIGNAIKYRSKDRPVLQISTEKQDLRWLFSIRDNGIGINPEYTEKIFGLFKRLHAKDKYDGTGIGLAICQRIVDRYHGRIWVESEQGKGSTFFFTVPG